MGAFLCLNRAMSKRPKKKRTKVYRGEDAATPQMPTVHRYSAEDRGKLGQWWFDNKKRLKIGGIVAVVGGLLIWFISELVRLAL